MIALSDELILPSSILLLLLIGFVMSRTYGRGETYLTWLASVGLCIEVFVLVGLFLLRLFPELSGNASFRLDWEELAGLFQSLIFLGWFLIGFLVYKALRTEMPAGKRWLLGMFISFFVTTTIGNALYEILLF